MLTSHTTPPGGDRSVVLFDGNCRFCTRAAKKLVRRMPDLAVAVNFQDEGALDRFPGITFEACMKRLHVVAPNGEVTSGAAALASLFARRPGLAWIAGAYDLPGVSWLGERVYDVVANARYRLFGKTACDGGTCHLHG